MTQSRGGRSKPLSEKDFFEAAKKSSRTVEEGFGRQLDLRDSRIALTEWEELLARLRSSLIICLLVGFALYVFGITQIWEVGTRQDLFLGAIYTLSFLLPLLFIPFGVAWVWEKTVDGGWFIFSGIFIFAILFVFVLIASYFLGVFAFIWKLKRIADTKEEIAFLSNHIAELEQEQEEAYR